jgi:hypothetical protein
LTTSDIEIKNIKTLNMSILNKYYKVAKGIAEKTGKELSSLKEIETLIGTHTGFSYDGNLIFFEDDAMLLQEKSETDPNCIHEIAVYEIEEL